MINEKICFKDDWIIYLNLLLYTHSLFFNQIRFSSNILSCRIVRPLNYRKNFVVLGKLWVHDGCLRWITQKNETEASQLVVSQDLVLTRSTEFPHMYQVTQIMVATPPNIVSGTRLFSSPNDLPEEERKFGGREPLNYVPLGFH